MGRTHQSLCQIRALMIALLAAMALAALATPAWAQAKKSDAVVKIDARADKPDAAGKQNVTITIDIEKPWHLYANPVGLEDLVDSQTVVAFTAKTKPEAIKIDYPEGQLLKDATVGNYKIWEGKAIIKAQVQRAKGDGSPLEVSIKFQACNEKMCLLPATVKVQAP
jgi:hypothetical protein